MVAFLGLLCTGYTVLMHRQLNVNYLVFVSHVELTAACMAEFMFLLVLPHVHADVHATRAGEDSL